MLIFATEETQHFPFSAAMRRPYSAKSRFVPGESTQTIFDFNLFATTQHTVPRQVDPNRGAFSREALCIVPIPLGQVHRCAQGPYQPGYEDLFRHQILPLS